MKFVICILFICVAFVNSIRINDDHQVQKCEYTHLHHQVYISTNLLSHVFFYFECLKIWVGVNKTVVDQFREDIGPIERGENVKLTGRFEVNLLNKVNQCIG